MNASDNSTTAYNRPVALTVIYVLIQAVLSLLITFNNTVVISAFIRYHWLRSKSNAMLVNLSCADLIAGMIALPLQIALVIRPPLLNHFLPCLLRYSLSILSTAQTTFMLIALSADRYVAISDPLRYPRIIKRSVIVAICCVTWMFSISMAFAPMVGWNNWYDGIECRFTYILSPTYILILMTTTLVMMIIMVTLNARVYYIAKQRQIRLQRMVCENMGEQHGKSTSSKIQTNTRAAKTLLIVTTVFVGFTLPYVLMMTTEVIYILCGSLMIENQYWLEMTRVLVVFLSTSNSFMNPIIYHYNMLEFRTAFRALLRLGNKEERTNSVRLAKLSHRHK